MVTENHLFAFHQLYYPQECKYVMNTFKIKRSLLPIRLTRHRYMYQDGRIDYLGQFLIQLGYNVEGNHRFPSSLGKLITPFTQQCRGTIIDSCTTLQILALDYTSPQEHEQRLREILPNWVLIFE